jgi:pyruvate,orthophosphate dikinase
MYADVVMGIHPEKTEKDPFEVALEEVKSKAGKEYDSELDADELKEVVTRFKAIVKERGGREFPQDPKTQLIQAIDAVFLSWMNERAIDYRREHHFSDDWGTAVNIQTMVFGNMGEDSATGVMFTRSPSAGENKMFGEFLVNAQGEDVVAGVRTPLDIDKMKEIMPEVYQEILEVREKLENHYRDMQDVEFTIQKGVLYILQTRNGKRTGFAAVRIALDMLEEGKISEEDVLLRVEPDQVTHLLRPVFDFADLERARKAGKVLGSGLPAGPGAAVGRIVMFADEVKPMADKWTEEVMAELAKTHTNASHKELRKMAAADPRTKAILVRHDTKPEDVAGMMAAEGVLTAFGGRTSHAALVARQRGKTAVVGCKVAHVDYETRTVSFGDRVLKEGDMISLNGFTGEVFEGEVQMKDSEIIAVLINKTMKPEDSKLFQQFDRMMKTADKFRRLGIRTNADRGSEAAMAVAFGAEGIGLARTEHMFFKDDRIPSIRRMIFAKTEEDRRKALAELIPFQRADFEDLFMAMEGRPVTIRTLDPPLHEFLPNNETAIRELADSMGLGVDEIHARMKELTEANPMLGHRGCRLGITYPEVTEMQTRAIIEAAINVKRNDGIDVEPELMIPLVGKAEELKLARERAETVIAEVFKENKVKDGEIPYKIGTMIEVPRAAVTADLIAEYAEFFSFGTNDLTQMGCGFSRDDAGKFLKDYVKMGIYEKDPFQVLDQEGIGKLVQMGVELGRKTRPNLKVGICGEHGGEPESVKFCHRVGLNYVSCSPFRVPIARLAAAQAVAEERLGK